MTNNTLTTKRNCSIDIFRIICALTVVAAHTELMSDINNGAGYIGSQIIPRIAVPFFLCVAGFYYSKGLLANKSIFKTNIKRLLIVYTIWSFIYILIYFLLNVIRKNESIIIFTKKTILNYFVFGSCYQLWYFPALFFCIFVVTFFNKIKHLKFLAYCSILLYILGLLGCSYYRIGNEIPVIRNLINSSGFTTIRRFILMGLPFFMLGYFLNIMEDKYYKISNKKLLVGWGIILVLFLIEIVLVVQFKLQVNIFITLFLYPLVAITMILLFKNPLYGKSTLSFYTRGIANFVFYSHPIFITSLPAIGKKIANIEVTATPMFLMTTVLAAAVGFVFIKINSKWLNKTFL